MRTLRFITALGGLTLSIPVAHAQIGTSTLTGRIIDATSATVAAVAVTVVQKGTNFTFNTTTNDEGLYRVLSLNPGVYQISVEATGFKKSVRDEVELRTGDTLAVDFVLQVGDVAELVEVTGATSPLETETSATGAVLSGSVLYDLPLYQRFINSTLNLVPGMTSGGYAYGGDLFAYHLAGQRSSAIGIFEDGVNGNDQQGGMSTIKPLQNSVAEVKVLTTVPPAEYGHSAGGVISVVKKSGANEYHGMASWYGRTRNMQHRFFFDKLRASQPAPGRPDGLPVFFMMPDGTFCGPIVKNKTFFFAGYQRLLAYQVAQVDATTPTEAMRGGNFNFSGVTANPIFDPATTRRDANGNWARDPFPSNIIPPSRFDPVARNLLAIDPWVSPNRGGHDSLGPRGNLLADEFSKSILDDYNLRLDHQFSPYLKFYGSWTENRQNGRGRPTNIRPDMSQFDASQGRDAPFHQRNVSAGKTWIVSPSIVNDARAGYYRRVSTVSIPGFQENWAHKLGIPNAGPELVPGFGGSSTDRYSAETIYGIYGASPSRTVTETLSLRDDLSIIHSRHAFKAGYEVLRFRLNSATLANPILYSFAGVTSGLQPNGAPAPNTGNTFAGFLTGYVSQAIFRSELTSWLPRSSIHSFYFQDDWKLSPSLTMNWGVRYSNESPFNTKYGLMSNFDPSARDDVTGRTGAIVHPSEPLNKRDNNNFNPRLGLAWHPKEKWVFRGGAGMYTIDVKFPLGRPQYDEYVAIANQQSAPGDPTPIYRISQATSPPAFNTRPDGSAPFIGTNFGSRSAAWWDPNLRNPYALNWHASIQRELATDYLVEVSYQGSAGAGLIENWQANTFPVDFGAGNPALQNQVFAAPQNFRPYSHMGDIFLRSNYGHSTFHSGTVRLEKRLSRGLFFNTFYTFAKAINSQDNDNAGAGVAPIQNRALEKARAGYDRNHRFIGVLNYELPFGRGKRWANVRGWKNLLVGGWEVSWIQTVESGNPLNFSFANSPYNYYPAFAGTRRPDIVSIPSLDMGKWDNGGPDRFTLQNRPAVIDINAFAWPSGCGNSTIAVNPSQCNFRMGNAGRNIITGPGLLWSQVSAQKNFRITERWNAQLRWDFQNALKTYNFTGPTTGVDFRNSQNFGKLTDDPRTASLGGSPLMNLTVMIQF